MEHKYTPSKLAIICLKAYEKTAFNVEFVYADASLYRCTILNTVGYRKTKQKYLSIVEDCNKQTNNDFVLYGDMAVSLTNVKDMEVNKIDGSVSVLNIRLNSGSVLKFHLKTRYAYALFHYYRKQKSLFLKKQKSANPEFSYLV